MRNAFLRRSLGFALFLVLVGAFFFCSPTVARASATLGTIDPNNTGAYLAQLVSDPGLGAGSDEINFGKFTSQSAYNITISSSGLRGFAWGAGTGWIVTNCLDTVSGCSSTNGNFKVSVASDGTLSGYAWGENAGWVNFGPFVNSATPQVKINSLGVFAGTSGSAGYAWSQNFGWIKFDCADSDSCTVTDYVPSEYVTPPSGGGTPQTYACSDSADNDTDGLIDYPTDPGCTSTTDTDEFNAPSTSGPYSGSPAIIPGTIQAERYDLGGQGVAYNDSTPGNTGGAYRTDDVDIESDSVIDVGWTTDGEWLRYAVNVLTTGNYTVTANIATPNAGDKLRLEMDGTTIATFTTVNTSWWQTYQPLVVNNVALTSGVHTLRFVFSTGSSDPNVGFNLDYVKFELGQQNSPPTVALTAPTAGQSFTAPASIGLAATASDSDGTIKRVDFYNGGTLLGSDSSAPYQYSWNAVGAGTYTLSAKALDNQETVATSNTVTVTVTAAQTYACSDSADNDTDGLIDYPTDPGCTSTTDTDEFNAPPPVPTAPTQPTMPTTPSVSDSGDSGGSGGGSSGPVTAPVDISDTTTTAPVQPPAGETPPGAISPSLIPSLSHSAVNTQPVRDTTSAIAIASLGVATGIGVSSSILLTPFIFSDLWALLLAFLGWRRKKWGVVYDSKTKQPIDPAYVVLHDIAGKEVATCITDLQGRYGFLVSPGVYTITVNKTHYEFPSKRLAGHDYDSVYDSLYFGEPITIDRKEQAILKNIPLDPLAADWNEIAKREQGFLHFFARHEHAFRTIANILFIAGFIIAIASYLISPLVRNLVVIVVYVLIFTLQRVNILRPRTGNVIDARNKGLPYALVEIYNAHIDQKITTKVTSAHGRFLGIVPKGTYYAKVFRRDSTDTETYTPVVTTEPFDAPHGYIEKEIRVPASNPPSAQPALSETNPAQSQSA